MPTNLHLTGLDVKRSGQRVNRNTSWPKYKTTASVMGDVNPVSAYLNERRDTSECGLLVSLNKMLLIYFGNLFVNATIPIIKTDFNMQSNCITYIAFLSTLSLFSICVLIHKSDRLI